MHWWWLPGILTLLRRASNERTWRNQLVWRSSVLKIVLETIILEREQSQGSSFFALARSGSEQSFRIKFAMKFLKWNENCLSLSYSGRYKLVLYFVMHISRHLLRRHCIVYLLIVDVYTRQWNTCMVVGRILPATTTCFESLNASILGAVALLFISLLFCPWHYLLYTTT